MASHNSDPSESHREASRHHEEPSALMGSPAHLGSLSGALSPEDIQELLGGVLDDVPTEQHGEAKHFHIMEPGTNMEHSVPLDDARAAARSERKRSREKQRRSDVNKQFATLTDLLRQIETSNTDLFAAPVWTDSSFSPTNRVELMARTIHVLQTLERAHKRQKTTTKDLEKQLEVAKKAGEEAAAKAKENMMAPMQAGQNQVVMMVPMLIGGGTAQGGGVAGVAGAAAAAPSAMSYMHMPSTSTGESVVPAVAAASAASAMPAAAAMPWMMPPAAMAPWGMPMPAMVAPPPPVNVASVSSTTNHHTSTTTTTASENATATAPNEEESKQPPASESTTTSNLAHCA